MAMAAEVDIPSERDLMIATMDRADGIREQRRDEWIDRWASALPNPSQPYAVKDWVRERIPDQRDLTVRCFRKHRPPDPADKSRADVFFPKWTGPWEIVQLVSPVSVKVVDPMTRRKMRKLHVNQLKPYLVKDEGLERA